MAAETAAGCPGGWIHTGDAGYLDDCGPLFMVDRLETMIITDEVNAYSAWVKNAPAKQSGRAACAVRGIPYPGRRESIVYGYAVRPRTHPAASGTASIRSPQRHAGRCSWPVSS